MEENMDRENAESSNPSLNRIKLACLAILAIAIGSRPAFPDAAPAVHGPKIVMIIRHAEKPDASDGEKDPNLSKRGYQRADALAKVIPDHFPKPDYLIATKKSKGSDRPAETITPLSKVLKEPISATEKDDDFGVVAKDVLTNPKYDGKVVLIAWHHGKIPELAKALGVRDAPEKWDPKVFDRVWEVTFENGKAVWKDVPEKALPGDSEK
jgi:phosphohistidine phosphatase SixA